jgi:hypothetical protein
VYRIESIIQERRRGGGGGGGKEYLVKLFGYNSSFNSWISDNTFPDIKTRGMEATAEEKKPLQSLMKG